MGVVGEVGPDRVLAIPALALAAAHVRSVQVAEATHQGLASLAIGSRLVGARMGANATSDVATSTKLIKGGAFMMSLPACRGWRKDESLAAA